MFDELEIAQVIDSLIPQSEEKRIVSIGQAVKAMVLNGLGFINTRLYLVPSFFKNKPIDRLLGDGINAEHLNDDVLGRALDSLYEYGVTPLFSRISTRACRQLGLSSRFGHLDSTSFHVDGRYNSATPPSETEKLIHITRGYSRDHRPDLNQMMLDLIVENKANIPVMMKALDGNSQDKKEFPSIIAQHADSLINDHGIEYFVCDSALYVKTSLQAMEKQGIKWISRVPETIGEAKIAIANCDIETMTTMNENYRYQEIGSNYADVEQRWVVIYSQHAYEREIKTLDKKIAKESEKEAKKLAKLCTQEFPTQKGATDALSAYKKSCKYIEISSFSIREQQKHARPGRPKKDAIPDQKTYFIEAAASIALDKRAALQKSKGFFIVATNELDASKLSSIEVFEGYKNQGKVEKGFRFLKDPSFLASSIFLKSPQRIEALLMVMTICLMVYAALEYKTRKALTEENEFFPNQKGKPIQNPTMKWIFQCFVGIHVLIIRETNQQIVLNLNHQHLLILKLLKGRYQKCYQ